MNNKLLTILTDKQIGIFFASTLELDRIFLLDFKFFKFLINLRPVIHATCTAIHNWIMLRYDNGTLRYNSKFASSEFIYKMAEIIIILFLWFHILNGEL
jgi:hypothetical protein